jgi:hypothetical protein
LSSAARDSRTGSSRFLLSKETAAASAGFNIPTELGSNSVSEHCFLGIPLGALHCNKTAR